MTEDEPIVRCERCGGRMDRVDDPKIPPHYAVFICRPCCGQARKRESK